MLHHNCSNDSVTMIWEITHLWWLLLNCGMYCQHQKFDLDHRNLMLIILFNDMIIIMIITIFFLCNSSDSIHNNIKKYDHFCCQTSESVLHLQLKLDEQECKAS